MVPKWRFAFLLYDQRAQLRQGEEEVIKCESGRNRVLQTAPSAWMGCTWLYLDGLYLAVLSCNQAPCTLGNQHHLGFTSNSVLIPIYCREIFTICNLLAFPLHRPPRPTIIWGELRTNPRSLYWALHTLLCTKSTWNSALNQIHLNLSWINAGIEKSTTTKHYTVQTSSVHNVTIVVLLWCI